MPRDGSNIYHIPPGTEGIPDTTIESDKYNAFVHDVEQDLNAPRPIVAGGTGADDADEALDNIGAEKRSQQVTNFDSHAWVPGSFYSATSATNPPVASHAFAGIVYTNGTDYVVEAVDLTDTEHKKYIRAKVGGTWSSWADETGDKVEKAGDTMTGPLEITSAAGPPTLYLNKKVAGVGNQMIGQDNGKARWILQLGDSDAEAGGNTGAHFNLFACDDAGGALPDRSVLHAERTDGLLTVRGNPTQPFGIATKQYTDEKAATAIPLGLSPVPQIGSSAKFAREDHVHPSLFSDLSYVLPAGTDLNTLNIAGYYSALTPTNGPGVPGENWYHLRNQIHAVSPRYVEQTAVTLSVQPAQKWFRTCQNGTWFNWVRVIDGTQMALPADYTANAAASQFRYVTPWTAWGAAQPQTLPSAVNPINPDLGSGINFFIQLISTGYSFGNPINQKPGQSGVITIGQDATGGRTITFWDPVWKFPGALKPVLSSNPGCVDAISYHVLNAGFIECTFNADLR